MAARVVVLLLCSMVVLLAPAQAGPLTVNHQGFLTNAQGAPLNGTVSLVFRLFSAASGGSALYSESHPSVQVVDGVYSVELGSITPFLPDSFDGSDRWIEVAVNGETLAPRQHVTSVPYALNANRLQSLAGLAGIPCNAQDPSFGNLSVAIGAGGGVSLTCAGNTYTYTLTVTGVPTNPLINNGVTSSPAGISCHSDCSEAYLPGTVVTLYAVQQTAVYVFTGWSGACTNTTGPCVVTMDASKTVTAHYGVL